MERIITIDGAGRLVLPKEIRRRLRLHKGSRLRLVDEGNQLRLEPLGEEVSVAERDGVPVVESALVGEWMDHREIREERLEGLAEPGTRPAKG